MNKTQIIRKAIKYWGEEAQQLKAIEECSELIKALCKYQFEKNGKTHWAIVDEIIDVEIMLRQLKEMFYGGLAKEQEKVKWESLQKRLTK